MGKPTKSARDQITIAPTVSHGCLICFTFLAFLTIYQLPISVFYGQSKITVKVWLYKKGHRRVPVKPLVVLPAVAYNGSSQRVAVNGQQGQ